jgi:hypothetical protein
MGSGLGLMITLLITGSLFGAHGIYAETAAVSHHVPLPEEVRGIYWTAETARTQRANELFSYMLETGINTIVIDIKMDNGEVVMPPQKILDELGQKNI